MNQILDISQSMLKEIHAHAIREYPSECCGMILGPRESNAWTRFYPCQNMQDALHKDSPKHFPRTSRTAYIIGSKDHIAVDKILRATEGRIAAIYHSHIDKDAYFSEEDIKQALYKGEPFYPDTAYLVFSVKKIAGEIKVAGQKIFYWNVDTRCYEEGEIPKTHSSLSPLPQANGY